MVFRSCRTWSYVTGRLFEGDGVIVTSGRACSDGSIGSTKRGYQGWCSEVGGQEWNGDSVSSVGDHERWRGVVAVCAACLIK